MSAVGSSQVKPVRRIGEFVLFLLFGLLIFVVFSHMRPMLPEPIDLVGRTILILGFLVLSLLARRKRRFES